MPILNYYAHITTSILLETKLVDIQNYKQNSFYQTHLNVLLK